MSSCVAINKQSFDKYFHAVSTILELLSLPLFPIFAKKITHVTLPVKYKQLSVVKLGVKSFKAFALQRSEKG